MKAARLTTLFCLVAGPRFVTPLRVVVLLPLVGAACKPNLDDTVSIITTPRVLAVRAEGAAGAAEFAPGESFDMTALYVDASGAISPSPIKWAFCNEPKPLAELGPVSSMCLDFAGDWFTPLGAGDQVHGSMPDKACQLFGPEAVTLEQRPVDADPSGGYYQPVQLLAPGKGRPLITVGESRIVCTLASPSADVRAAFKTQYVRNRNPVVASLGVVGDANPWAPASATGTQAGVNHVAAGRRVKIEVTWPACPGPSGGMYSACAGAEHYLLLDTASRNLVDKREAVAVAWYATAGAFDVDRSGRASEDLVNASDNEWNAPGVAGTTVNMWVVLRDERGGVGWEQFAVQVQ